MKSLKVKFSLLAIILASGAALAGNAKPSFATQKWARNPSTGLFTDITGQEKGPDYGCTSSSAICTAVYPEGVDPNDQAHDSYPGTATAITVETGLFN